MNRRRDTTNGVVRTRGQGVFRSRRRARKSNAQALRELVAFSDPVRSVMP